MSIDEQRLRQMIKDDYLDAARRLKLWVQVAEEALQEDEVPRQEIFDLLFWNQTEFYRRRIYLKQEMPELELRGSQALRVLDSRGAPAEEEA